MKSAVIITKDISNNRYQEHLEWDDESEACDEDLASMSKCVISLSIGVMLTLGVSLYFMFI